MSVMPDASMTATRTVLMRVLGMNGMCAGSHRSPVIVVQGTQLLGILPTGWARQTESSGVFSPRRAPAADAAILPATWTNAAETPP